MLSRNSLNEVGTYMKRVQDSVKNSRAFLFLDLNKTG